MTHEKLVLIAGVDEVGRGPLVGPVVAAAVVLDVNKPILGLRDSKKLSVKKRAEFEVIIKRDALCYCVAQASAEEIDQINILQASFLAMKRAIAGLSITPEQVLVDGNKTLDIDIPNEAIVKGDDLIPAISAASILAKEHRDKLMADYATEYPEFGFEKHKGYPTKLHMEKLAELGVTPEHRRSFKPVIRALQEQK